MSWNKEKIKKNRRKSQMKEIQASRITCLGEKKPPNVYTLNYNMFNEIIMWNVFIKSNIIQFKIFEHDKLQSHVHNLHSNGLIFALFLLLPFPSLLIDFILQFKHCCDDIVNRMTLRIITLCNWKNWIATGSDKALELTLNVFINLHFDFIFFGRKIITRKSS